MNCEQRKILVVEPDPSIRALVVALLVREGYVTEAVDNADAALEARRSATPAAVVVEPRMCGGDLLLETLRTDAEIDEKVIIMTTPDVREPAYMAGHGVRGVLRKPFYLEELTELVASCVNDASARREPAELRAP